MNKTENLISSLEAMLFAAGDPVEAGKPADVVELDNVEGEKKLRTLRAQYDERKSGFMLIRIDNKN